MPGDSVGSADEGDKVSAGLSPSSSPELIRRARATHKLLLDERTVMKVDRGYRISPHELGLAANLLEELAEVLQQIDDECLASLGSQEHVLGTRIRGFMRRRPHS
jgi:hypothetical protein